MHSAFNEMRKDIIKGARAKVSEWGGMALIFGMMAVIPVGCDQYTDSLAEKAVDLANLSLTESDPAKAEALLTEAYNARSLAETLSFSRFFLIPPNGADKDEYTYQWALPE